MSCSPPTRPPSSASRSSCSTTCGGGAGADVGEDQRLLEALPGRLVEVALEQRGLDLGGQRLARLAHVLAQAAEEAAALLGALGGLGLGDDRTVGEEELVPVAGHGRGRIDQARRALASTAATGISRPVRRPVGLGELGERRADALAHLGRLGLHLLRGAHRAAQQAVPQLVGCRGAVGELDRPDLDGVEAGGGQERRELGVVGEAEGVRALRQRGGVGAGALHRVVGQAEQAHPLRGGPRRWPRGGRRARARGRTRRRRAPGAGGGARGTRPRRRRSSRRSNGSASASASRKRSPGWRSRASATMPGARSAPTGSAPRAAAAAARVPGPHAASSSRVPGRTPAASSSGSISRAVTAPISAS